jgi:hypothetical protein
VQYEHQSDYEICMKLKDDVPAGNHVMTITPNRASKENIILAWLVIP